jgi:tRNA modification GTPase
VEGLGDLLKADTEAQRKQALHQMGGGTEKKFMKWREDISAILAHVEAVIDFSDDDESVDELSVLDGLTPKVLCATVLFSFFR